MRDATPSAPRGTLVAMRVWSGSQRSPSESLRDSPAPTDARREPRPGRDDIPADADEMIRSWRCRMGLTQGALAYALGVGFATVSRWENGHGLPSRLAWHRLKRVAAERGWLL